MSIYVRDAGGNRQKIAGVGLPGPAGKSAYQYAVEGGFSGTEEEFRAVVGVRSNPNLLDNWYFADPINQRGKMEYTGEGYTICRWELAQNDTNFLKIENGFIHVHIGSFGAFGQFVTGLDINSKYTFSFLTNENELAYFTMQNLITTGSSFPIKIGNRTIQLYVYNTYVSNPKAENVTAFLLHVPAVDDAIDINFVAAKLELGPVQTLAHKEGDTWVLNDPPPNKALELAKCQRYYRRFDRIIANTGGISTAYISPYLNYSDMRATPLFLCHGGIVDGGGLPINASIVRAEFTKNSGVIIQLNESFSGSGIVQFLDCSLSSDL